LGELLTTPSQPDAPEASPDAARLAHFEFEGFALNRLAFEHVAKVRPDEGETKPAAVEYNLGLGASIRFVPNGSALVSMEITVEPNPKWYPYKIALEVVGRFKTQDGTVEDLKQFCARGAPPILFPYVREIIHRVTQDAKHGTLRINPINIGALLNQTEWQVVSDTPQDSQNGEAQAG
jgi:preprotein translocase subunit SecB